MWCLCVSYFSSAMHRLPKLLANPIMTPPFISTYLSLTSSHSGMKEWMMLWFPKAGRKIKTDMGNVWACVPFTGASRHMLTCFNLWRMSKGGIYFYLIKIVNKSVVLSCTPCILPFWRPWHRHRAWLRSVRHLLHLSWLWKSSISVVVRSLIAW